MCVFFFKQKTAYEMRISDWSSDVCSSDLLGIGSTHGHTVIIDHHRAARLAPAPLDAAQGIKVSGHGFAGAGRGVGHDHFHLQADSGAVRYVAGDGGRISHKGLHHENPPWQSTIALNTLPRLE